MSLPEGVFSSGNKQNDTVQESSVTNPKMPEQPGFGSGSHYSAFVSDEYSTPLQWFLSLLLYAIPIVNIFYVSFMAFKSDDDRKNWAKAALFMLIITYILNIAILIYLKNTTMAEFVDIISSMQQ